MVAYDDDCDTVHVMQFHNKEFIVIYKNGHWVKVPYVPATSG